MTERGGWFATSRGIFYDPDVTEGAPFCPGFAWEFVVGNATFIDRPEYLPPLKRGQYATTAGKLADAWGWSRDAVKNILRRWERRGMIARQSHGRCTVITVLKYEKWQAENRTQSEPNWNPNRTQSEPDLVEGNQPVADERTQSEPNLNPNRTQSEPATKRHGDTGTRSLSALRSADADRLSSAGAPDDPPDLKTKAGRARHWPAKSALPKLPGGRSAWPAEFIAFCRAYPHGSKRAVPGSTYTAWRKVAIADAGTVEAMQRGAEAYARQTQRKGTAVEMTKMATTWINAELWATFLDGVEPEAVASTQEDMWGGLQVASDKPEDLLTDEQIAAIF